MLQRILSFLISLPMVLLTLSAPDLPGTQVEINADAVNAYITDYGAPMVSAHRSGAGLAPENTLMAIEACLKAKNFSIDIFEFDVQLTKDGQLVLLHDSTYDATSNAAEAFGHPYVTPAMYTLEELQVLNLGENFSIDGQTPYRGLRGGDIPANLRVTEFGALLARIEKSKKRYRYIIEIKDGAVNGMKSIDRLYAILEEQGLLDRAVIGTFWPLLPYYMDWRYPGMSRSASIVECLQFYYYARTDGDLTRLRPRYAALQIPCESAVPWPLNQINFMSREIINYAHKYDIAAQYWTVNDEETARLLKDNGCDAIMSDYPDMLWRMG